MYIICFFFFFFCFIPLPFELEMDLLQEAGLNMIDITPTVQTL